MRALFLHANNWGSRVESASNRIGDCMPEAVRSSNGEDAAMRECLVVLFHVEKRDNGDQAAKLCRDVSRIASELRTKRILFSGFRHLSSSNADPNQAKSVVELMRDIVSMWPSEWEIQWSHFGYNKTMDLSVKGHRDAFKFREYTTGKDGTWTERLGKLVRQFMWRGNSRRRG